MMGRFGWSCPPTSRHSVANRIVPPTTNLEETEPVWHLSVAAKVTRYILNPRSGVDSAALPTEV